MQRLLSSLVFLLLSGWAQAQDTVPAVPTQEAAGTSGDSWLILWIAIAAIIVAIGMFVFLRRGGRTRM
jgi:hypothetical protein